MELHEYFQPHGQIRALQAFSEAFGARKWPVYERLEMYESFAFRPSKSTEGLRHFTVGVYEPLSAYWQVWRPLEASRCWHPEKIFRTISDEFSDFGWSGEVTLVNFGTHEKRKLLIPCLTKLAGMKVTKQGYPIMPVTKFLHFYNPSLFAIYDEKVVWEIVLGKRFNRDFRDFHLRQGLHYETGYEPRWIYNYLCYGSWLLSKAHPQFMDVFSKWLKNQPSCEDQRWQSLAPRLYATALEFTIIGAATAEGRAR